MNENQILSETKNAPITNADTRSISINEEELANSVLCNDGEPMLLDHFAWAINLAEKRKNMNNNI